MHVGVGRHYVVVAVVVEVGQGHGFVHRHRRVGAGALEGTRPHVGAPAGVGVEAHAHHVVGRAGHEVEPAVAVHVGQGHVAANGARGATHRKVLVGGQVAAPVQGHRHRGVVDAHRGHFRPAVAVQVADGHEVGTGAHGHVRQHRKQPVASVGDLNQLSPVVGIPEAGHHVQVAVQVEVAQHHADNDAAGATHHVGRVIGQHPAGIAQHRKAAAGRVSFHEIVIADYRVQVAVAVHVAHPQAGDLGVVREPDIKRQRVQGRGHGRERAVGVPVNTYG